MKKKKKLKKWVWGLAVMVLIIIVGVIIFTSINKKDTYNGKEKEETIKDFKDMEYSKAQEYAKEHNLELKATYIYSDNTKKNIIIKSELTDNLLELTVSKGSIPIETFKEKGVDELGKVPIMMYHQIIDTTPKYIGGNVDKDGYSRTSEAFLQDLEFYYKQGYRMIRLKDYVNGEVNVPLGYSPIILTFDDGNANNFKVIGKDENGNLEFDPKSAIGILESIKKKYPDFNVTATFFLNAELCNQKEYNEDIMKWLIKNGYDIGNHTTIHPDFTKISIDKTQEVVGKMYQILENIIPDDYLKIVALPFGSPYKKNHANYQYILKGEYDGKPYETVSALRVGWESEVSPFDKTFDKTFLKRCRAYDNNGSDFDIEMNFKLLEKNRYISDGDSSLITIPESKRANLINIDKEIVTY